MSLNNFEPFTGEDLSSWTGPNFIVSRPDVWGTYVWIVACGALAAFAMAWSIGANDVANSFATSVGSKTLTLWQACIIAAIFEFVGSIALGGEVAKTVAGGITSPSYFQANPEVFAYGMLCALTSAATIVTVATYYNAAVSTTHSIIGAVLGFGLVYGGVEAIIWNDKIPDFPYRKGVVTVFLSWFVAPTGTAILGAFIFILNRTLILRRQQSTRWALWSLPVLVFVTVYINCFFVLYKGASKELQWDKEGKKAGWVSAIVASGACLIAMPCTLYLRKYLNDKEAADDAAARDAEANAAAGKVKEVEVAVEVEEVQHTGVKGMFQTVKKHMTRSLTMDVHEDVDKEEHVAAMHANAEVFSPKTENVYKYLQVLSACCVAFAHGANDVANAIGPFSGIWYVYQNYNVSSESETPKWILAMGGAGLVAGLSTYGYKIIKVLGVKLAKMTPSRGYSAELATALMISLASVYGLPVSTTQCIVGAEVGVGLSESIRGTGLNWRLLLGTMFGWVVAFFSAALFSAAIFSAGVYAPSINDLDSVNNYNNAMTNVMRVQLADLNATNVALNRTNPTLYNTTLARQLSQLTQNLTSARDNKKYGKTNQYDMMLLLKNTTKLYLDMTVPTVGYSGNASRTDEALTVPR